MKKVAGKSKVRQIPLWFLILCSVLLFAFGMTWGRFTVKPEEFVKVLLSRIFPIEKTWSDNVDNVIWAVRFPRLLGAFLVGAALSISGSVYQGIFKNPLVSPDLLGVSSGACVGASVAILSGGSSWKIQLYALLGGLLAVLLTTLIPKMFHNQTNLMLVLAGIIVSGFFSSAQGLLKYVADPDTQLATITFWTMGSLAKVNMKNLLPMIPAMVVSMLVLSGMRWRINIMALGEAEAKSLGVNLKKTRGVAILAATVLTSCSICLTGTIGWIGLVMPHLGRLLVGPDNKRLIPASIFLGASFLIIIDTLARSLTGSEIPLSILTGFIGAPFYTWLLIKQRTRV